MAQEPTGITVSPLIPKIRETDCSQDVIGVTSQLDNITTEMSAQTYEIALQSGIPVPTSPLSPRWPLREMKVNESFAVPRGKRGTVAANASRLTRQTGKEFTIRIHLNPDTGIKEVRCWRLK